MRFILLSIWTLKVFSPTSKERFGKPHKEKNQRAEGFVGEKKKVVPPRQLSRRFFLWKEEGKPEEALCKNQVW